MADIRHTTVDVNGIRIHCAEQGRGPLVLLVHGFPELWYSWRHQLPALADAGFRAVAIDQRGYGRSSKIPRPLEHRISRLVGDVTGLVSALGEKTAVIVGHDWGAPVAWTAAWQHPEVFRAVAGISVPFSGRGLVALPGCPFGEIRPSEIHRRVAGEGQEFYQDYFGAMDAVVREIEKDLRGWLRAAIFGFSGDAPLPPGVTREMVAQLDPVAVIRSTAATIPFGREMRERLATPDRMPSWFTEEDLDVFVSEFERTGFAGGLAYYHSLEASWEELAPMEGKPLTVPALFVGGDLDAPTLWGAEAIARAGEHLRDLRGSHVLRSGHWIQQEQPEETNRLLVEFLETLR